MTDTIIYEGAITDKTLSVDSDPHAGLLGN